MLVYNGANNTVRQFNTYVEIHICPAVLTPVYL